MHYDQENLFTIQTSVSILKEGEEGGEPKTTYPNLISNPWSKG